MHHGHDFRARLEDLAVDEALGDRLAAAGVQRIRVEVVLDHVLDLHALRGERARQVIALRIRRRAQADMPVGVDHAVFGEDAIRSDEVFEWVHVQSAFIPAALTTRVQRASSLLTRSPMRSGGPPMGIMPCLARSSRMPGSLSTWLMSAFRRETRPAGVPAGANAPYQVSTSRSGSPCSLSVGTSGKACERSALMTPSARSLPAWTCGCAVCIAEIIASTWPPMTSASAPAAAL